MAARDKKLNREKHRSQKDKFKSVAKPPPIILNVYNPDKIKRSNKGFCLK